MSTLIFRRALALLTVLVFSLSVPLCAAADEAASTDGIYTDEELDNLPDDYRIVISRDELAPAQGLNEDWLNILLLGTDTRSRELNRGRTDAMIVVSIHRETGEIKLISLHRDMWVNIYNVYAPNRINAAHSFGGPLLAIRTVNDVLGLNITKFASVNFYGFEDAVNSLGGVDIALTRSECSYINEKLRYENADSLHYVDGGPIHLNGAQALWYTRIRVLDSINGRNERQRKMLVALAQQATKGADVMVMLDLVSSLLPYVSTNLSLTDFLTLLSSVMANSELNFETLNLPAQGDFHYDEADDISKVIFKAEETRQKALDFIYGE